MTRGAIGADGNPRGFDPRQGGGFARAIPSAAVLAAAASPARGNSISALMTRQAVRRASRTFSPI